MEQSALPPWLFWRTWTRPGYLADIWRNWTSSVRAQPCLGHPPSSDHVMALLPPALLLILAHSFGLVAFLFHLDDFWYCKMFPFLHGSLRLEILPTLNWRGPDQWNYVINVWNYRKSSVCWFPRLSHNYKNNISYISNKETDISIVDSEKAGTFCHVIVYLLLNYFVVLWNRNGEGSFINKKSCPTYENTVTKSKSMYSFIFSKAV